jgi:hypothetical protein
MRALAGGSSPGALPSLEAPVKGVLLGLRGLNPPAVAEGRSRGGVVRNTQLPLSITSKVCW